MYSYQASKNVSIRFDEFVNAYFSQISSDCEVISIFTPDCCRYYVDTVSKIIIYWEELVQEIHDVDTPPLVYLGWKIQIRIYVSWINKSESDRWIHSMLMLLLSVSLHQVLYIDHHQGRNMTAWVIQQGVLCYGN